MSEPTTAVPPPSSDAPEAAGADWVVPRWLKVVFAGLAALSLIGLIGSTVSQVVGGKLARAKTALDAQELEGPARNIVGPRRGGGTYDLADSRGKIVLVNFWATWCAPCRDEMPSLARLAQQMDPSSFQLVAVSVDDAWTPIETFFEGKPTPYPVVLDLKGDKFSVPYGTTKFPETYLIDQQGNLKLKFIGPRNWGDEKVMTLLEQLGAKRAPPRRL